jgi:hypothetical protein
MDERWKKYENAEGVGGNRLTDEGSNEEAIETRKQIDFEKRVMKSFGLRPPPGLILTHLLRRRCTFG